VDHDAETSAHSNQPQLRIYMTSKHNYFCVYRITNLVENKHYYGYKSSKIHPSKVIGVTYFSSLTKDEGKAFRKDQKENPQNYKYKIVQIFNTHKEALAREIRLHTKFDVGVNPNFYNKAKQTSTGFDTTGKFPVKDAMGNTMLIDHLDIRYINGDVVGKNKNMIPVKDKDGKFYSVHNTDPRWLSGELVHNTSGMVSCIDKDGNKFSANVNDPRYISGEIHGVSKGYFNAKDSQGNRFFITKEDERFKSGELVSIFLNTIKCLDKDGNIVLVEKNDEKYLSVELTPIKKKKKPLIKRKNTTLMVNIKGNVIRIDIGDSNYNTDEYRQLLTTDVLVKRKNVPMWISYKEVIESDTILYKRKRNNKFFLITPWGEFLSCVDAVKQTKNGLTSGDFKTYCYKSNLLITNKSKLINILGENIIGKSYQECGFSHRINC